MMIETMAGKACATHGIGQDCTPFLFTEENRADEYMGEMLRRAGQCCVTVTSCRIYC